MPTRDVSTDFLTFLSSSVLTLALCAKLVRTDGVGLTFTSHDRNVVLTEGDGTEVTYIARNSVEATALRQEASGSVDNVEVNGLLQSDLITDADIRAGLYDGAFIELFVVNFRNLAMGALVLQTGYLGEVSFQEGQFTAEVRSLTQKIAQQVGELTSPLCRVKQLGDSRCKVDLEPYRFEREVATIDSVYVVRFSADTHPDDYYTYGVVEVTSGLNVGIKREIKDHVNVGVTAYCTLQESFPYAFELGDSVILEAGCDRRFETCRDKFDNVVNFRGEPHVPGTDKIIHYGRK